MKRTTTRKAAAPTQRTADRIVREERKIEREEKHLERLQREVMAEEHVLQREQKTILRDQRHLEKETEILKKEEDRVLVQLGFLKMRKRHVFNFAKIFAGALVGTGLGLNFVKNYSDVSMQLPWWRVLLIAGVSLLIACLLIYRTEKDRIHEIKSNARKLRYIIGHVLTVYVISLIVVALAILLFVPTDIDAILMVKMLFVGSFSAVAGAITFSL